MADTTNARVAVYIDFDNIVISRFEELRVRSGVPATNLRGYTPSAASSAPLKKLVKDATVDIGAVLDFASSFGEIVLSRAYADWSIPLNASYAKQLVGRAVDLVQMFPTVASKTKNGADIRLAVDVVEDLFRLTDLTHIFIVAGDSDYIAVAQRSKRLGRAVIGVGVAGSSSESLAAACDEFFAYDELPGVKESDAIELARIAKADDAVASKVVSAPQPKHGESGLLYRALLLLHSKDDSEWVHLSGVKTQMLRMEPSFNEKALKFASFTDFVKSRASFAELDDSGVVRLVRLRNRKL